MRIIIICVHSGLCALLRVDGSRLTLISLLSCGMGRLDRERTSPNRWHDGTPPSTAAR